MAWARRPGVMPTGNLNWPMGYRASMYMPPRVAMGIVAMRDTHPWTLLSPICCPIWPLYDLLGPFTSNGTMTGPVSAAQAGESNRLRDINAECCHYR